MMRIGSAPKKNLPATKLALSTPPARPTTTTTTTMLNCRTCLRSQVSSLSAIPTRAFSTTLPTAFRQQSDGPRSARPRPRKPVDPNAPRARDRIEPRRKVDPDAPLPPGFVRIPQGTSPGFSRETRDPRDIVNQVETYIKVGDVAKAHKMLETVSGETLRQIANKEGFDWEQNLDPLVALIRRLHAAGIYFRSLHLGNIVVTPDNQMGLIDVADLRFLRAPLSPALVKRNLQHFARYIAREKLNERFPMQALEQAVLAR